MSSIGLMELFKLSFLAYFLLALSEVLCVGAAGELQLNPLASLVSEVSSVFHNKTSHHVVITLAENRKCAQPTFMVRLSGTSLYLLDQVHHDQTNHSAAVFHYPHLNDIGTYFLEVLTMYCETLNPNAFTSMCLIHPRDGKNVLTLPYSFEVKTRELNAHPRPRWVLRKAEVPALLPTRFQKMCGTTFCKSQLIELAQHNLYEWTDKPSYEHLVQKTLQWGLANITQPTGRESITICMVGASHAALIWWYGNHKVNVSGVNFMYVNNKYPQMFDVALLTNCTYAVVGYGQWPLSTWMGNQVYTAERYETEMRIVLSTVKASNLRTQVFTRSMNLNGLGYKITDCPSSDYRHPPLVMMYNSIMAKLSAEYGVPYIDGFHLQGPLWDAALDWSHPRGSVAIAEAELVIHSVLSYSHTHHRAPVLVAEFSEDFERLAKDFVPPRVRFTDSDTVYLIINGQFRAVPSTASLRHLGYTDNAETVVEAHLKPLDLIGPPLPDI